ncbi:hypothetical protein JHK82_047628 [Glycine max]|nr:hypothetical protein JHK82_047628 [Glycine max]KAH1118617.1 hypothetical protein GYH30_047407 [Glycine max]
MNLKLKSFEQWDAPEENGREGRRGRLEFFSEKENQETQQPHPGEGNTPEKNPHCVTVVLPEKDAGGVNFFCRCGVVREEARRGRATQSGEDHEVKIGSRWAEKKHDEPVESRRLSLVLFG